MLFRRTRCLELFVTAICAIGPVTAGAQVPSQGPMTFEAFDQNDDGAVTEQEFATAHAERWAARAEQGAPMRGAASAPAFSDFDRNGDGRMTKDEFIAGRQARMQGRPGMGQGMGPGAGMGRGMGMNMPSFSEFDLDGSGVLTEQEFYDARAKRMQQRAKQGYPMFGAATAPTFEQVDGDGDKKVTADEFAAAQRQHHQRMMQQR
jgi:Ca2+-binding EF-hand superfamily protein